MVLPHTYSFRRSVLNSGPEYFNFLPESYALPLERREAVEAIKALLQLGLKTKEIHELVLDVTSGSQQAEMDWFSGFLAAQAALATRDYGQAVKEFKQLDVSTDLS